MHPPRKYCKDLGGIWLLRCPFLAEAGASLFGVPSYFRRLGSA
jgi:hypothetical protein